MFFLGKLSVTLCILLNLLLFVAACAAYNKWRGKPSGCLSIRCVPFYFLQLFLLLLIAPLRPEGIVIHLSEYRSSTVKVIPVLQDKPDYTKAVQLKVRSIDGEQRLNLDLLRFKDKPRHYVMEFGKTHDRFDILGVSVYTTFFSHLIPAIQVPGNAVGQFFSILSEPHISTGPEVDLHDALKKTENPPVLLFRLTDDLARYAVWQECARRSVVWSLLCTIIFVGVVLVPVTARLALLHAKSEERNMRSALAYYYLSTLIACFSLFIFVLVAEYGTRFYYRDVLSTSSGVNYFYNKSNRLFVQERNTHKFRGGEFKEEKSNKVRIVVIGDSISYGQGVYPYTLRYPELVEQRLNSVFPEPGYEVINLGVCGLDLPDYVHLLPFVKELHPDFVLYQWFINDMDFMGMIREIKAPELIKNRYWRMKLMNNSSLYYFLQRGWNTISLRLGKIKSYDQHIQGLFADDNSASSLKSNERLLQLLNGIKDMGVATGVVLFPHAAYTIKDYPFAFMHERIKKICEQSDIPCLDLRSVYSSFDDHLENLWVNKLDPHPSALAHDLAAREVIDFFGPEWSQQAIRSPQTGQVGH